MPEVSSAKPLWAAGGGSQRRQEGFALMGKLGQRGSLLGESSPHEFGGELVVEDGEVSSRFDQARSMREGV